MASQFSRRGFVAAGTAAGLGLTLAQVSSAVEKAAATAAGPRAAGAELPAASAKTSQLALLGGKPVRTRPFPKWPQMDQLEDKALLEVLRSGRWFRGDGQCVNRFEEAYARLTGSKRCVAVANGTGALVASLGALEIGPGDEVIVPPYTFVATVNAVLLHYALPIFVDSDPDTFQIDARKIEAAVTERTAAIVPVHLGGSAADMDTVLAVAKRHKLAVIEDACQAHLAEWRGRKVGTLGNTGCFSFQVTKNLCSGEGGAILTQDDELLQKCYAFHGNLRTRSIPGFNFQFAGGRAMNLRMTEFQGALLLAQMTRLEEQTRTRRENARCLTGLLGEIPGIRPARMYEGCTANAYHLYMFRYDPQAFAGVPRAKFLEALRAEGVPGSGGYSPLNKEAFLKNVIRSRPYRKLYSPSEIEHWEERTRCPANERLCGEAVWLTQPMLLGPRSDMEQIAEAVRKIQANAAALARA
ncbi:MAG: DegT/DnrJ/EryC1/StrS family aminotransferase [Thermoguttaceae bacterium]|jgi:dTDP-4-amino-4,6-dideoxygalactose transaminase